jgi:hypothetical protein
VQTVIAREGGQISVLMYRRRTDSGDDLPQLIEACCRSDYTHHAHTTEGVVARDDKFLAFLQQHRRRIEVYLQFDGWDAEAGAPCAAKMWEPRSGIPGALEPGRCIYYAG